MMIDVGYIFRLENRRGCSLGPDVGKYSTPNDADKFRGKVSHNQITMKDLTKQAYWRLILWISIIQHLGLSQEESQTSNIYIMIESWIILRQGYALGHR
jgi:hypothetical protein